ncbi:hypothetical protein ECZU17_59410 [Escherichia coli]|nr:hypothetical protein ECZU17_59410 [Escherichia coli]
MRRTKPVAAPMVARVYLRVSTDAQDLERQEAITTAAKAAGYYVAGIYRERHPAHAPTGLSCCA